MDANWGMAIGGVGIGFGCFMLRSAAVVWTNGRRLKNGNGITTAFCNERSGNIMHWMEKIDKRLERIEQSLRK